MKDILDKSDACLRDMQSFHEWFDQEKGFDTDILRNVGYLAGEIGEVVKAIRDLEVAISANEDIEALRDHVGEELADCVAYILKLSNYANIDLQDAYLKKMKHNLTRTWKKRTPERSTSPPAIDDTPTAE